MVYRCMFAGMDLGRAQWVCITPGEEPRKLEDLLDEDHPEDEHFCLLTMEGETAPSLEVAIVLGRVVKNPILGTGKGHRYMLNHLQQLGVKWDSKPLDLKFTVLEHKKKKKLPGELQGNYSYSVEDKVSGALITEVDGFKELEEVFSWIMDYFLVVETYAQIPIRVKELTISDKLKKEVRKSSLEMFKYINNLDCQTD